MDNDEFDMRLDRVSRATEVVSALPKHLQADAFSYLFGDVASDPKHGKPAVSPGLEAPSVDTQQSPAHDSAAPRKSRRRNGSKAPKSVSHDTSIELFPEGKQSFKDFAREKSPSSMNERYAVAVFWILRVAELPTASVAEVMACFMAADWRLPSDPLNAGSQSRKAGYLSSAKSEDLQLSSIGVNLVKSDLPRSKATS